MLPDYFNEDETDDSDIEEGEVDDDPSNMFALEVSYTDSMNSEEDIEINLEIFHSIKREEINNSPTKTN